MIRKIMAFLLLFLFGIMAACSAQMPKERDSIPSGGAPKRIPESSLVLQSGILIAYTAENKEIAQLAKQIQNKIGGNLYPIEEKKGNDPAPDISGYQLILVGGPAQEHMPAEGVKLFLKQIDFQGKKVSPFWVDSQYSMYYELNFAEQTKNAVVLPGWGLFTEENLQWEEINQEMDGWLTTVNTWNLASARWEFTQSR